MTSVVTTIRRGINSSAAVKVPVKAATTANITLSGEQTIDGISCVDGDRVLVKNQTDASENGIYTVDTSTWDRAPDWDGEYDVKQGTYVYAAQGSTNNNFWQVTTSDPITIGTTNVAFQATDPDSLLRSNLADTSAGQGASLIGIQDSAGYFAGGTVEAALAEAYKAVSTSEVTAYCTSTTTINNSTTYTEITGMSLSLEGASYYAVEGYFELNQAATAANMRIAFVVGAGASGNGRWDILGDSTSDEAIQINFTSTISGVTLTTDVYSDNSIRFKGWVQTSPAGNATVQFRQDSAVAANTSIIGGSWMKAKKLS